MNQKKIMNESVSKEIPFEDVLQEIMPMIHRIAMQVDGIYGLEVDDVKQELSLQAFYSWEKWEPGRGTKFSTYVYEALIKKKNSLVRTAKAQKRNGGHAPASLDEAMDFWQSDRASFQLYDVIPDPQQNPDEQAQVRAIWEAVESALGSMQEKGQRVVRALLEGYTQVEVSRATGITQPLVSYYLKSFRTKVAAELER